MERICYRCKETKSLEEFKKDRSKAQGRSYLCKLCDKEANKKRAAAREIKHQEYVSFYKASSGCFMCGEKDPVVLDLHHINPNDKDIDISQLISNGCGFEKLRKEIAKCRVVCANDHRRLHSKQKRSHPL